MATAPSSAIGVDVGRHTMKAVLLQRRGARLVLTHFATRELMEEMQTADTLASNLKALLQDMGGSSRACGITISSAEAFVRIIEQPAMPPVMLRNALRLNSSVYLNQDCKDYVLDCDVIPSSAPREMQAAPAAPPASGAPATPQPSAEPTHYVVAGIPREKVTMVHEACLKARVPETVLQVAPLAMFNAFEFAHEETFSSHAFVLVDIGYVSTTIIVGVKRELILVRTMEYGGRNFVEELICHGAASFEEIVSMLQSEEVSYLRQKSF